MQVHAGRPGAFSNCSGDTRHPAAAHGAAYGRSSMQQGRRTGRDLLRPAPTATAVAPGLVLACFFLALCNLAEAQPRSPAEASGKMTPDAEPHVWLRRLAGRYEVDGAITPATPPTPPGGSGDSGESQEGGEEDGNANESQTLAPSIFDPRGFRGKVDCVAIGSGPGVQCVLNIMWIEDRALPRGEPIPVSYLDPSMLLLGLDPLRGAINMFLVDDHGLGEGGWGRIGGNMAVFKVPCTNARVNNEVDIHCERITRFEARPDARVVHVWIDIQDTRDHMLYGPQIIMTLRRAAEETEVR
jgi:hypothetical protein